MSRNHNLIEALEIYHENGLDEIISEKSQNHFLEKENALSDRFQQKKIQSDLAVKTNSFQSSSNLQPENPTTEKPIISHNEQQKISIVPNFVNPYFSTSDAISALAKKSQNLATSNEQVQQSISIKAIVEEAKKMAQAAKNLSELRKAVERFEGCSLKKMATNTVFCDGNSESGVMLIGEAPGNNEDLQGIPFCGDSGKVLDAMFKGIDMIRSQDFYITNTIFWRPPGNRKPTEEELAICRPFVERHIELVQPKVIILVGATAIESVLKVHEPISKIRGKLIDFAPDFLSQPTKTFAIFHPSYLMRQPSKKKVAWLDMMTLQKFLKG